MTLIGLATWEHHADLTAEDRLLAGALRTLGVDVTPVVWSRPHQATRPHAVVIRSCWDYHRRYQEFLAWVTSLEREGVVVLNPPALLRWNAHKRYLIELSERGVTVPALTLITPRDSDDALDTLVPTDCRRVVVKPAISASAYRTWTADYPLSNADRARVRDMLRDGDVVIQRFVDDVITRGEMSFVFIDGTFSHAVRKVPADGDFRVQADHGGRIERVAPPPSQVAAAAEVIARAPVLPLYARVDAVVTDDAFLVMELELIEPHLFFDVVPQPIDRFARAIIARTQP